MRVAITIPGGPHTHKASVLERHVRAEAARQVSEPSAGPVSITVRNYVTIPPDWSPKKRRLAEERKLTPHESMEALSKRLARCLIGVTHVEPSCVCQLMATSAFDDPARLEIQVTQWRLSFDDNADICLEQHKTDALYRVQKATAKRYRVRALHEIVERQMVPVAVDVYGQKLFEYTKRTADNLEVLCEGRKQRLLYSFDALVDIQTGSLYRDGVCCSSSQLEIVE
jgi:hypothetical protein